MIKSRYYKYNGLEIRRGNLKLGPDTLIFNLTSATDCPSRRLGLCQLSDCNHCYALKAERLYPGTLPYRRRQAAYWDETSYRQIIDDFVGAFKRFPSLKNVKYVRINEAGDFRNRDDLYKLNLIAFCVNEELIENGFNPLVWYGYSARSDLDLGIADCLLLKSSGHHNYGNGKVIVRDEKDIDRGDDGKSCFTIIDDESCFICPMDCKHCNFCKKVSYADTLVIPKH